jgi:hypothetical protein
MIDTTNDGPEVIYLDDEDDYEQDDLWATSYDSGWSKWRSETGYAVRRTNLDIDRVAIGAKMIKSFVDTFSRPGERYTVTFNNSKSAQSSRDSKQVQISAGPLYDNDLSHDEAGRVLMGLACHEAGHSRYGADHEAAVRRIFGTASTPHALSNLLDDIYLEASFIAEYPGFAGIFAPVVAWVGKQHETTNPRGTELLVGVRATRYHDKYDWAGMEESRDWWTNWAATYAVQSTPKHVEGIRVALERIVDEAAQDAPKGETQTGESTQGDPTPKGETQTGESTQGESVESESAGEAPANDVDLAAAADATMDSHDQVIALQQSEVSDAANVGTSNARSQEAQNVLDDVRTGEIVDGNLVQRINIRQAKSSGRKVTARPTGAAAAAIRMAFMRGRGGHTDITKGTKRGRCDNSSLWRVANNDPRMFHRRSAPSPRSWLVWIMVDWSSSMSGEEEEIMSVARAFAAAARTESSMRLAIKLWTSPQPGSYASAGIVDVWQTGDSMTRLDEVNRAAMGGTPDALTMKWARRAIAREVRGDESPMIVMVSDGAGFVAQLTKEVAQARKDGIEVLSVAAGSVNPQTQETVYGPKEYVAWAGSITKTAGNLARLLVRKMA